MSLANITVGLEPTCPPCFTEPLPSFFYFSLASSVFCKDLPVRNSVSEVFTIFVPRQHHRRPENQPVRVSVSASEPFPAHLLSKLYFLSLSRCFRFLISHVPSFLLYCKMQIISFSASPVLFSFPLLSLSKKIILSVSPLHGLCRLSYVSLVSSVFCKDPPVRNSVSEVFTVFAPLLHPRRSENQPVRPSLQSLCCLFTFRSCRSFPAKTFLSEIPSPWSLLSLLHACITISPKTDLSENLSRLRAVFPADLLFLLYILSLSRCFRFLVYKCSFSLISPFSSSLASFFFPCGLALAPLAFSLRLSVWKNFPFHIYINELTLSTLLRDKNNVPDFFLF